MSYSTQEQKSRYYKVEKIEEVEKETEPTTAEKIVPVISFSGIPEKAYIGETHKVVVKTSVPCRIWVENEDVTNGEFVTEVELDKKEGEIL